MKAQTVHICRNWCRRSQKIRALRSICLNVGKETMYTAALEGELWNHSYYVETVGSVSEENIRRYIEHQSKAY